jgi:hypothetical protein
MTASGFLMATVAVDVVVVALVLAATYFLASQDALIGVAVGGVLGVLNLFSLAWLCGRLVATEGTKWPWAVGLALKFALLIGVVFLAVTYVPMDVIGFVVGLSASGLAMVLATSWLAIRKMELTP